MYTVIYEKSARKILQRMPREMAIKINEAFKKLALDPARTDVDIKPMIGREGYRLKMGGWRAIYHIDRNRLIISVIKIGPRGDVYK
ncbi:plasmid stabilization system [Nitrosococcus halophilus Nc 4]|uniref:Plasmid stabilization system n=1 Tax=Nitrosococcus halophilus (strain Nc4) TaxID=472759 RepID=D5BZK1_NITHN|nr:type II toxin-antitoxin system RelE/ParE family toxin [Nitrosococcus halophilus]ADE14296.1 plasmid stabilization system [Nitrosococcus halophilus Nc 4]